MSPNEIRASNLALAAPLGATYEKTQTTFRVWAPGRETLELNLYRTATGPETATLPMQREGDLFTLCVAGDLDGVFYTYGLDFDRVVDPYARAASLNGKRGCVVDLRSTDPVGFARDDSMALPVEDAIVYEVHVADFTFSQTSGAAHRGKYVGFVEEGTRFETLTTGLDHLKELGITHVHLMPIAENATVDESPERFGADDNYNWGYDPLLYNVPEGAFATDPSDPKSRIRELKALIQALHEASIGVILDVVYNHTYQTMDSNFNRLAPGYYYRQEGNRFSNGSGVGNELASERPMVRKFIIDSLLYWQREYGVDGFRFDLMALTDTRTVQIALAKLRVKNPNVLVYGEPWVGARSALPSPLKTVWKTQNGWGFGLFNEAFRDAIKGDVDGYTRGFVQGNPAMKAGVEIGLTGSIDYAKARNGGAEDPVNTVNYFNAHDNLILEDKLTRSLGSEACNDAMTRLAFGILLTSQGIAFFHAGNEFRRTKGMDANSYHSPYCVNAIDWSLKKEHLSLFHYVKDLIALRKRYDVFTLHSKHEVKARVHLLPMTSPNLIATLCVLDDPREFLLCFYYNGWDGMEQDLAFLFDALKAYHVSLQRIFDETGQCSSNRFTLSYRERARIHLEPISLTIYKGARMR